MGVLSPKDRSHEDSQFYLADTVRMLLAEHNCNNILIEIPPQTIYDQESVTKDELIARAQSVFRVVAVAHFIMGMMSRTHRIHTILPVQWQAKMKARAANRMNIEGMDVKEISRIMANATLEHVSQESFQWQWRQKKNPTTRFPLESERDSNAGDAVNMLFHYILTWQLQVIENQTAKKPKAIS